MTHLGEKLNEKYDPDQRDSLKTGEIVAVCFVDAGLEIPQEVIEVLGPKAKARAVEINSYDLWVRRMAAVISAGVLTTDILFDHGSNLLGGQMSEGVRGIGIILGLNNFDLEKVKIG